MGLRHANLFAPDNGLDHVPTSNTGEFLLKLKFFFLRFQPHFNFPAKKKDRHKLLENDTIQGIPNLKCQIFDNFKGAKCLC